MTELPEHRVCRQPDDCDCGYDGDVFSCIDGKVYGPCEYENCNGVCWEVATCDHECHGVSTEARTREGQDHG